jgi:hypothetical protein
MQTISSDDENWAAASNKTAEAISNDKRESVGGSINLDTMRRELEAGFYAMDEHELDNGACFHISHINY